MGSDSQRFTESSGPSQRPPKKRRLFFALWPNAEVRKAIAKLNRELPPPERGERLMSSPNLHLTLHYIGSVDEEAMLCLKEAAQKVSSAPFTLELDCLGYFKRPKVLWLGCEEIPEGYAELLKQLAEKIADCGFNMEEGSHTPHVTLRRKVTKPKEYADVQAIEWAVEQFVLVASVSIKGGISYQVIESYRLKGA